MKILLSNDDGIYSEGIYQLSKSLSAIGEVFIAAPDREQSATGHAITMHQPLRCNKIKYFDTDIAAWWVNGTPADCVKLGIETLMQVRPDIVVSGINRGENLGTDVIYSGTVSAAIEGAIFGIPSFAFSYEDYDSTDFSLPAEIARDLIMELLPLYKHENNILNINIPALKSREELAGIKITKLGVKKYKNNFEERKDPRGRNYYWLAGELIKNELGEDTDIYAVKNKYISITPMSIDLTDYDMIDRINKWNIKV